jgi:hypothetical protein
MPRRGNHTNQPSQRAQRSARQLEIYEVRSVELFCPQIVCPQIDTARSAAAQHVNKQMKPRPCSLAWQLFTVCNTKQKLSDTVHRAIGFLSIDAGDM